VTIRATDVHTVGSREGPVALPVRPVICIICVARSIGNRLKPGAHGCLETCRMGSGMRGDVGGQGHGK
jgi:hypothetical protein